MFPDWARVTRAKVIEMQRLVAVEPPQQIAGVFGPEMAWLISMRSEMLESDTDRVIVLPQEPESPLAQNPMIVRAVFGGKHLIVSDALYSPERFPRSIWIVSPDTEVLSTGRAASDFGGMRSQQRQVWVIGETP